MKIMKGPETPSSEKKLKKYEKLDQELQLEEDDEVKMVSKITKIDKNDYLNLVSQKGKQAWYQRVAELATSLDELQAVRHIAIFALADERTQILLDKKFGQEEQSQYHGAEQLEDLDRIGFSITRMGRVAETTKRKLFEQQAIQKTSTVEDLLGLHIILSKSELADKLIEQATTLREFEDKKLNKILFSADDKDRILSARDHKVIQLANTIRELRNIELLTPGKGWRAMQESINNKVAPLEITLVDRAISLSELETLILTTPEADQKRAQRYQTILTQQNSKDTIL